jgi:hypothetical protein
VEYQQNGPMVSWKEPEQNAELFERKPRPNRPTNLGFGRCGMQRFAIFAILGPALAAVTLLLVLLPLVGLLEEQRIEFGGAAMAYVPRLLDLPHDNVIACSVLGIVASLACWWLSIRDSAKPLVEQA